MFHGIREFSYGIKMFSECFTKSKCFTESKCRISPPDGASIVGSWLVPDHPASWAGEYKWIRLNGLESILLYWFHRVRLVYKLWNWQKCWLTLWAIASECPCKALAKSFQHWVLLKMDLWSSTFWWSCSPAVALAHKHLYGCFADGQQMIADGQQMIADGQQMIADG